MINIETHQIIDMIESRQEEDVKKWLKTYPNIEIISRDGGIMYKSASEKAHARAKQISDRFHILKNLTDYAKEALKRILKKQIVIEKKETKVKVVKQKEKYAYKTKWDIILKVKELREQKYRIIDIAQYMGTSEKTVIKYIKIKQDEKEKYNKIPTQEKMFQIRQNQKWKLIQEVQKEYKKNNNYSEVARKFKIDRRTVKIYLKTTKPPVRTRRYYSKLDRYKNKVIEMTNEGYSYKLISKALKLEGYEGSDSLLRRYISKVKKENISVVKIKNTIERSSMISLLYKELEQVKSITKELLKEVIEIYPEVDKLYKAIKEFKGIMFNKKEKELDIWIEKTKRLKIQELNSFIAGIERDIKAVKNGIKYKYNNGLAEGCVNKIKLIKRTMYGRCSFELLKQKVLLQYR